MDIGYVPFYYQTHVVICYQCCRYSGMGYVPPLVHFTSTRDEARKDSSIGKGAVCG
jgi:hypothetical protein